MKRILLTSAAALFLVAPAGAQTTAPAPVVDSAPAVPETAIGVQERRRLMTSDDATAAPSGMLIGEQSGSWYVDCTDPGVSCENYEGLATGSVGGAAPDPVVDSAPAVPDTAIGVQERRRLNTSDDATAAPSGQLIERQ
ncbi:hypothetical protein [Salinarimonas ramus]|uniref:Uncharacterized protein n=1 Tax=Salinarimonas ramus TaxID=690164 RepID=A0A917V9I4_9HYPH|nr:hypothetical protein [Salinarimonas ramus]GGK54134.1 hypothetical protein GCM10011322_46190 [Salinarimonas ramus]